MSSADEYSTQQETTEENYLEGEITQLSAKTIEIYQIQGQLADRIWAYLNQYSAMLLLIGIATVAFKDSCAVQGIPHFFAFVLSFAYLALAVGNHRALSLTMDELFVLRNIAVLQTRLKFSGSDKGSILRFHALMILITVTIFFVCWGYAKNIFNF